MSKSPIKDLQWQHPREILKLQKLRLKKKALQDRINGSCSYRGGNKVNKNEGTTKESAFENVFNCKKRKNCFIKREPNAKRAKINENITDDLTDQDQTLFKLLNNTYKSSEVPYTSFCGILNNINQKDQEVEFVKATGQIYCPIDWTLRKKMRIISMKAFPWNSKLKISEEASGITSFTRCLDIENTESTLDASSNAKFHQCCLIWQHPFLPWLQLFPRNSSKTNVSGISFANNIGVKSSLFQAWSDSFRSLFQLLRTRQCPYFYLCANNFTSLFRAAGILGNTDIHVSVTPTTRGFRNMLRQEEIEFTMPLKNIQKSGQSDNLDIEDINETENMRAESPTQCAEPEFEPDVNETPDEEWLKTMGINNDDIKQINYTQARIVQKTECEVDNSDQSLIVIEGVEVNAFFNFIINCKSIVAPTGPLAGIPPTLLSPVSFHGATLNNLKVRENMINSEGTDFYSLELMGPILPSTLHNLFNINTTNHSMTVTFSDIESTRAFSKSSRKNQRKSDIESKGTTVFSKENLSDCGLNPKILKHFCSADPAVVCNFECVKYSGDSRTFTWT